MVTYIIIGYIILLIITYYLHKYYLIKYEPGFDEWEWCDVLANLSISILWPISIIIFIIEGIRKLFSKIIINTKPPKWL